MSDARGRLRCPLRVWQTSALTTLSIPGGMQGISPCLPGTVNVGGHNTVDATEAHGGSFYRVCLVWELMAPTILVGEMSAPTTLLGFCYAREVVGYCPAGVQGTVLWYCG